MKKRLILIPVCCLFIASCNNPTSTSGSSTTEFLSSDSLKTSSDSTIDYSDVKSIIAYDEKNSYPVGTIYKNSFEETLMVIGETSTNEQINIPFKTGDQEGFTFGFECKGPNGASYSVSKPMELEGEYTISVSFNKLRASFKVMAIRKTLYDGYYKLDDGYMTNKDRNPTAYSSAKGDMNILVVPIAWKDQTSLANEANLDMIEKAFNGTDEDTKYHSLNSYYKAASYGNFNVKATVVDWYVCDYTYAQAAATGTEVSPSSIMIKALQNLYNLNSELSDDDPNKLDWSTFDADGNSYFDNVMFVNTGARKHENDGGNNNTWGWQTNVATSIPQTPGMPNMYNVVWINTDFLKSLSDYFPNGKSLPSDGINTKVIIHEFGHSLGLQDYYNVHDSSSFDCLGRLDMQDYNALDWNPFSKFTVGWMDPYIIDGSQETVDITIHPSAEKNEAIVVAPVNRFNDTPFSEYLMIDLYSPVGNNLPDAQYYDNMCKTMSSGVRIYHVNSNVTGATTKDYINNNSKGGDVHLLELVQAGKEATFMKQTRAGVNVDLDFFHTGDSFTTEEYTDFFVDGKMDSGFSLGYRIDIISQDAGQATIRFTQIGD